MTTLICIAILALGLGIGIPIRKRIIRQKLMAMTVPDSWTKVLKNEVPLLQHLNEEQRKKLLGQVHIFLNEIEFIGCNGLEINETIKVSIAAQACLLTLNNHTQPFYDALNTIYVYPDTFTAKVNKQQGSIISEENSARLGQSMRGSIVLSWSSCRSGASNVDDGHNVIFHEFAHQLDQEHGLADGVPLLQARSAYLDWGKVMYNKFLWLRKKKRKHQHTLIDPYGAMNEAEFFAVCTECFFEKPKQLHKKHPEVYRVLKDYYGLDPQKFM